MDMRFPRSNFPVSQSSDTLKVVKDVSLAIGTGFLGYLSNFLVNAINPHFFDSLLGAILLALTIPLVIALLYQQQRATPWSGLLIGFVVGIFQSFHFNWFQNHTDENMFKIALILLALMLLLIPPVVRLINQQNIFGAGLLRSAVSALIGWAFWTGGFALLYDILSSKFMKDFFMSHSRGSSLLFWLIVFFAYSLFPLFIAITTGSIVTYCSGADDTGKNSWTSLVAIFACWFSLCWSFWKINFFHFSTSSLATRPPVAPKSFAAVLTSGSTNLVLSLFDTSTSTVSPNIVNLILAISGLVAILIGVACALMDFGPVAWIHAIWEGCIGFFQEMFGTD